MSAPLSVVIPTLNAADSLVPTLVALVEGAADGLVREVVIADGGSTDQVAQIAEESGATLIEAPRGRGPQLRAGVEAARGDWLLLLHADSIPQPGWIGATIKHIKDFPDRAGWFDLAFAATGFGARWTAGWANRRSWLGLPYGDQGLVVSRALLAEIGGVPDLPLMEDVALARRLGRRRLQRLGATMLTDARRYEAEGWARRGWRNWRTLGLYALGVPPARLAAGYERSEANGAGEG